MNVASLFRVRRLECLWLTLTGEESLVGNLSRMTWCSNPRFRQGLRPPFLPRSLSERHPPETGKRQKIQQE
jgi:hypothetical protein